MFATGHHAGPRAPAPRIPCPGPILFSRRGSHPAAGRSVEAGGTIDGSGKSVRDRLGVRVTSPTTSFGAHDTVYASVSSEGSAPKVTLKARWTYQDGQLVDESVQSIAPTGPTTTEFHVAKPSGWPAGKYKVEISADGTTATTREFDVRAEP